MLLPSATATVEPNDAQTVQGLHEGWKGYCITARAIILFSSAATAGQRVAGLPAAARAVREAVLAGFDHCIVAAPEGWRPDRASLVEIARLCPAATVEFATEVQAMATASPDTLLISGERQVEARDLRLAMSGGPMDGVLPIRDAEFSVLCHLRNGGGASALALAGRRILAATAKSGDGIVSRVLNRRISQGISGVLLRSSAIRPVHATIASALIALVMMGWLIQGSERGLIIAGLLFQLASIIDGVDGEIARATFRSSPRGAMIDSLVDAATNLGFIGGVVLSLYAQGETRAAIAGGFGLAMLASGLTLIGRRSRNDHAGLTFDAVKTHFSVQRSRIMTWLTWLTMRDFFALVGAVLIIAGFAPQALMLFAVVATGWLAVVVTVMGREPA